MVADYKLRRMPKPTSFALLLFILGLLVSCQSSEELKIAYLHPSPKRMRFVKDGKFIVERLEQLGAKAIVVDSDNDESLQIKHGMELVDQGVDLLIIVPVNGITIAPLVRYAKDKGVPVIAYNRLISNVDYDLYFTGDNVDNALLMCTEALKRKPQGNYVVLAGDRFDKNGVELKNAIDSILKPHVDSKNISIIYESFIEDWSRPNATFEFSQVIDAYGNNIDAVIACGDNMATGVITTLKKHGMEGQVVVTGQNTEMEALKNLVQGYQHITIYHPHKLLGYKVAEMAVEIAKGFDPKELASSYTFNGYAQIPTFKVKSIAITKDNLRKELIESGAFTESELK
jgi:D-xylose transport system substrate-binding protein